MRNILYLCFMLNIYVSTTHGFHRMGMGLEYHIKQWNLPVNNNIEANINWIDQPVDHFDQSDTRTWRMRFYEDWQYSQPGGPIYILMGGEGDASTMWQHINYLLMAQMAQETRGAIIGSEHRYYGASFPLQPSSIEDYRYLSSKQALADVALLIDALKARPGYGGSKVVVVGGSYPGNLAAWMRLLYPDKVTAAVASSAPVLAQKDFTQFFEKVGFDYRKYGSQSCYDKIYGIFNRYKTLLSSPNGINQLKQEVGICQQNDLTNLDNQQTFIDNMMNLFEGNVQRNGTNGIQQYCYQITEGTWMYETHKSGCMDVSFATRLANLRSRPEYLSWQYQLCTEFGYFPTTAGSNNHPFTSSIYLDFHIKTCTALFGPGFDERKVDEGIALTNSQYGGRRPNVDKVVFVNGDVDPWSPLGVLQDLSPNTPARLLQDSTHCEDMFAEQFSQTTELQQIKRFVKQMVSNWLN